MRKFVSYIKNDKFAVGCTGQTVYIYDNKENEIVRFKDIKYGYIPKFCPNKNFVVVKSNTGVLVVYSLNTMKLIKKFRFSNVDCGHDAGFCFSYDGQFLFNIECHKDTSDSRIAVYETSEFTCIKRLFEEDDKIEFDEIECDPVDKNIYVLGFYRDNDGLADERFVAQLKNDILINVTIIDYDEYDFIQGYKIMELSGFTEESFEISRLSYDGYSLLQLKAMKVLLSSYVKK